MIDQIQDVTYLEAVVLLLVNGAGAMLATLAWRVSDVDVGEACRWQPPTADPVERARLRHNRLVITTDARHGEAGRLICHALIALIGLFWLLTPQPINPAVTSWAVVIRAVAIALSAVLVEKSLHHLVARRRFDHPDLRGGYLGCVWPALRLAWADMTALGKVRRT